MAFFYDLLPVLLFFIAFKFYGIYAATVVGIVSTLLQVLLTRFWKKIWDKKQLITFLVFVIFGGMTLYFHNPIFVKWKPTVIFWLFAVLMLGSQCVLKKPLMQRIVEGVSEGNLINQSAMPSQVWRNLNIFWSIFFVVLGGVNLYIAYQFSNDAWVNFKFYGITSAVLIVSIFQAVYMNRYLNIDTEKNKKNLPK